MPVVLAISLKREELDFETMSAVTLTHSVSFCPFLSISINVCVFDCMPPSVVRVCDVAFFFESLLQFFFCLICVLFYHFICSHRTHLATIISS